MAAPAIAQTVRRVARARDWNERVEEIRRVPETYGQQARKRVYRAIADAVYREHLAAQFAFVLWREEYEPDQFFAAYDDAYRMTDRFSSVDPDHLASVLMAAPRTLMIFRSIIGYTPGELAGAATQAAADMEQPSVTKGRVNSMEKGRPPTEAAGRALAMGIHRLMTGTLWEAAVGPFRSKLDKLDTVDGWASVQQAADAGVPYRVLLHQRHYGGAFRTLLDATSTLRGEMILEFPVQQLFEEAGVPFIRTGAHNQGEIQQRFGLSVEPAPDFVIHEAKGALRAILECKQTNDGGTARDKAARFRVLREEATRLGGVPVFAVLDGLGWERAGDALGPVVRDTDGRVFTVANLPEMLTVEPFPRLLGRAPKS